MEEFSGMVNMLLYQVLHIMLLLAVPLGIWVMVTLTNYTDRISRQIPTSMK